MNAADVEIVIVEDNPNDAELIARSLRKYDLANKSVLLKDGVEALEFLFAEGRFTDGRAGHVLKVILLDLKLPKIDGFEVLRRLKADARTREIPIVILTSSTEQRDLHAAYALGVNSYVTKPIQFSEFAKVVAELGAYWLEVNRLPSR